MMHAALDAFARHDRAHHYAVQTLSAYAQEFAELAHEYDGHVGGGEAIAQQSLLRDAATLRLVAALVIRGTTPPTDADLWIVAAARRLARIYPALRGDR